MKQFPSICMGNQKLHQNNLFLRTTLILQYWGAVSFMDHRPCHLFPNLFQSRYSVDHTAYMLYLWNWECVKAEVSIFILWILFRIHSLVLFSCFILSFKLMAELSIWKMCQIPNETPFGESHVFLIIHNFLFGFVWKIFEALFGFPIRHQHSSIPYRKHYELVETSFQDLGNPKYRIVTTKIRSCGSFL